MLLRRSVKTSVQRYSSPRRGAHQPFGRRARFERDFGAGKHAGNFLAPQVGLKLCDPGGDAPHPTLPRKRGRVGWGQGILGDEIVVIGARCDLGGVGDGEPGPGGVPYPGEGHE